MRLKPVGRHTGQSVQSRSEGFGPALQSAEQAQGAQHMRRVGALPPARFEVAPLRADRQQRIQEELFDGALYQATPELGEH